MIYIQLSCIRICVFAKTAFCLGQGNRDLAGNLFRRRVPSFQPQLRWSSPLPLKEVPAEGACLGPTSKQEGSSVPAIYLCLFPLNLTKVFAFDSGFECRKKRYPLFLKARLSLIHSFPCQFTLVSLIGESPLYKAQASVVINITYKSA